MIRRLLGLLRGDAEKRLTRHADAIAARSEKVLQESEATRHAVEQVRGVERAARRDA